jgi:hypothetical protein
VNVKECEDSASGVVAEVARQKEREDVKAVKIRYLNRTHGDDAKSYRQQNNSCFKPSLHLPLSKRSNGIVLRNSGLVICAVIRDQP